MDLMIQKASLSDVEELLGLYVSVYGNDYPLPIGTDKEVMQNALKDPNKFLWLVMRDQERSIIAGSCIVEIDQDYKIGKVTGVAVSQNYRQCGIARKMIDYAVDIVLEEKRSVHSLYATSRTVSIGSQKMLLDNNFIPLGIFPNARKIKTYETLTLVGKFAKGVLEKRARVERIPEVIQPLYRICNEETKANWFPEIVEACPLPEQKVDELDDENFEFIFAPKFVERRFDEVFNGDKESTFYPFHHPNLIISGCKSEFEIYASFSKKDHYCVWITSNRTLRELGNKMKKLIFALKEIGIYYIEVLVRSDYFETICYLTENRFLPSAIYPAMREENGQMHDYILLTRTMVPLDFSDTQIHPKFKPYINQYAKQWLHMNLNIVEGIQ
ncbi:MAG: hypothetical protein Fur0010_09180 [Bdellovibrio sp.]